MLVPSETGEAQVMVVGTTVIVTCTMTVARLFHCVQIIADALQSPSLAGRRGWAELALHDNALRYYSAGTTYRHTSYTINSNSSACCG
jgi:hypothetical protein